MDVFNPDEMSKVRSIRFESRLGIVSFLDGEGNVIGESVMKPEALARWLSTDPREDKYPDMSPYNFVAGNPIRNIDPNGDTIRIIGGKRFRRQAFQELQSLTNDKLKMLRDGTVIIKHMGGMNTGKYLPVGNNIVRNLNRKGDGTFMVEIRDANSSSISKGNNRTVYKDFVNTTNGIGTSSRIFINLNKKTPLVEASGKRVGLDFALALGHELIHSYYAWFGKTDFTVPDKFDDDTRKSTSDMISRYGKSGLDNNEVSVRVRENMLRKEHGYSNSRMRAIPQAHFFGASKRLPTINQYNKMYQNYLKNYSTAQQAQRNIKWFNNGL